MTEPLFCSNHVDGDTNITAVFPGCFENNAFICALLHSIMLSLEAPFSSRNTFLLKDLAIKNLQRDLEALDQVSLDITIGTILILSGTAVLHPKRLSFVNMRLIIIVSNGSNARVRGSSRRLSKAARVR